MEASNAFSTIDTHTAGEPTRIITDGIVFSPGEKTVGEYRDEFQAEHDWVRELLIKEPRGHDDMFGAVPVLPSEPGADLGLFFLTNDGYLDMCGHATIAVITAFVELGRLPPTEELVVETPVGLVETRPTLEDGKVEYVTIRNVESFRYGSCELTLESGPTIDVDVVYAGNFFAMVDSADLGIPISRANTRRLIDFATEVRRKASGVMSIEHPITGSPAAVELTEFYDRDDGFDRNLTVFGNGSVDRSPCGTGTCAKMTLLHASGELGIGETYHHRSVIDTEFEGELEEVRDQDSRQVVTPLIRGSAYIIARNEYSLDPDDPIIGFNVTNPK